MQQKDSQMQEKDSQLHQMYQELIVLQKNYTATLLENSTLKHQAGIISTEALYRMCLHEHRLLLEVLISSHWFWEASHIAPTTDYNLLEQFKSDDAAPDDSRGNDRVGRKIAQYLIANSDAANRCLLRSIGVRCLHELDSPEETRPPHAAMPPRQSTCVLAPATASNLIVSLLSAYQTPELFQQVFVEHSGLVRTSFPLSYSYELLFMHI